MYDWISISLVLSITILCPSVFNIKWIHFDGYYRCMSFWTAIMLWRVNNSSANAHTITLWSRSSLDSLASIAMWNLHPIWNGAYEICFKFFFFRCQMNAHAPSAKRVCIFVVVQLDLQIRSWLECNVCCSNVFWTHRTNDDDNNNSSSHSNTTDYQLCTMLQPMLLLLLSLWLLQLHVYILGMI